MEFRYQIGDETKTVRVEPDGDERRITIGERVYRVRLGRSRAGEIRLCIDGVWRTAHTAADGAKRYVAIDGVTLELARADATRSRRKHHHGEDSLTASMPGQVRQVSIAVGETVERGQTLVILEAMKMEIRVPAPHAGRVTKVSVREGQVVDRGQVLVELSAE